MWRLCVLGAVAGAGAASGRARARSRRSSVGVLVHGFDLGASDWSRVVWGAPSDGCLGRVPHGLLLAHRLDASVVLLGSGGTADESGVSEAQCTREMALARLSELGGLPSSDVRDLRRMLDESVLLEEARNTADELVAARELFRARRIQTVVLVSSPTHAPRCVRDAVRVFHGDAGEGDAGNGRYRPTILASPCDTDFAAGEGGAVVIEPAHRSDRPQWLDENGGRLQLHRLASRALRLASRDDGGGVPAKFHVELDALLSRYERRKERASRPRPPARAAAGPRKVRWQPV